MQVKDEMKQLPKEIKHETAKQLSITDVVNVARTSTENLEFFKPIADVRKLLHHVTRGNHEAVKVMLSQDMSLFYRKGQVTDCSGRTFENISGFEYALWALDKHMWTTILNCLPQNEEDNRVVRKLLNGQCDNLDKRGVTYSLNGQTITEKHFDFENTIIKELQTQVDSINAPGAKNWEAIDNQWREGVGGAQKQLPMHFVHVYCSNEPFYPIPKFISQPKSSKQFYNWATDKNEDWFSSDSKLGSEFAIYKGALHGAGAVRCGGSQLDLDAMKALCEVRTLDFIDLKSQLEEQAGLENHHQVVPLK